MNKVKAISQLAGGNPHGCNAGRIIYEIVEQYDKVLAEMQAFFI